MDTIDTAAAQRPMFASIGSFAFHLGSIAYLRPFALISDLAQVFCLLQTEGGAAPD